MDCWSLVFRRSLPPVRLSVSIVRADDRLPECPIKLSCIDCDQSDHYCPKEFAKVQAH